MDAEREIVSEADLCDAFRTDATADGWACYPEQHGWDLLLVRGGVQVGVQAKLRGGVPVVLQTLPPMGGIHGRPEQPKVGPQYRAVLVHRWPGRTEPVQRELRTEVGTLARHLRVLVLWRDPEWTGRRARRGKVFSEWLPMHDWQLCPATLRMSEAIDWRYYHWRPRSGLWLPPFVPNLRAGVPSPSTIGPWQIAACRLETRAIERGGWCTLADARDVTKDIGATWLPKTLLQAFFRCTAERDGRQFRWQLRRSPAREYPAAAEGLQGLQQEGIVQA